METETITDETTPQPRSRHRGDSAAGAAINLGPRDQLTGRLVYEGDLRVAGKFEGEAVLTGDLTVDGEGIAKAKLEARNLSVRGSFDGDATVRERLQVSGSGSVSGSFRVARLVIEDGAVLNGNIAMESAKTAQSPNGKHTEG